MARKKRPPTHENHERWLVSYADFITLLFAFFVVMFATSKGDKGRAKEVSESIEKALNQSSVAAVVKEILGGTVGDKGKGNALRKGPGGAQNSPRESPPEVLVELLPSMKQLTKELKQEIDAGKMQLSLEPRGLVVTMRQAAFFHSGETEIDPASYPTIQKVATVVQKLPNPIRLEGHTDTIPISSARFHSNWELSAGRSIAMLELLTNRFHIPIERLAIAGYAGTMPVDSNTSEEGRARNRRVDIVIVNQYWIQREQAGTAKPLSKEKPPAAGEKH